MYQRLLNWIKLVFDAIHFLIHILGDIESMLKDIVHLPLKFILEIMQLPSFLLNVVNLLSFTQLVGCEVLLCYGTCPF